MNRITPLQLFVATLVALIALYLLGMAAGVINGRMAANTVIAVLGDVVNMFRPHKS
jgi:hypothetical protein